MGGLDCSAHDLSASKLFVLVDILYVQLCIEITIHIIRVSVKYHMNVSKELTLLLESKVCRRFLIEHNNIIIVIPALIMEYVNIDLNLVATINCPAPSGCSCPRWHQQ